MYISLEFGSTDRETSPTSAGTDIATDNQSATPERESPQVTFDEATNTEPPLSSDRPENESEMSKQATTTEDESESKKSGGKKRKKEKKGGKKKGKKKKKGKGGFVLFGL